MHDVPFVDAHVHFWDLAHLRYPWLQPPFADDGPNGSVESIARTYLPGDYRAEAAGWNVVGAVHVDAGAHPEDALAETQWLEGLAVETGLPDAIIAFADLSDPAVDTLLARHAEHGRVRGIRHIANWHPDAQRSYTDADLTRTDRWAAGFGRLADHGLSFDLQCYPAQMIAVARIAQRHPEVPVMVNHLGMPVLTDPDGLADWRRGMTALARLPQVSVKLSGFGFIRRDWDAALVHRFVTETIDLFGVTRVMAASDFPTDRLFGRYDAVMGALADAIGDLTPAERRAVWGGNACRLYRIDPAILGDVQ
ncbi:amidohydrolase family protein [Sphingomonas parapaucimobilis]|uniref:amidohydrolase family protein n=1 Tax=Sphingomonas parapaucimobilis TaxID=28213 RepID=UPI003219E32B